jgi:hypothetical protein
MKTLLMHPDRDFVLPDTPPKAPLPFAQDIELDVLFDAAAAGDRYVRGVMVAACTEAWSNDVATVRHRQAVLEDFLAHPDALRQLYAIAAEPFGHERSWHFNLFGRDPSAMVGSAVRTLLNCVELLRRLRDTTAANAGRFTAPALLRFAEMLAHDLDEPYLRAAAADLENLTFRRGLLLSAAVGDGGKGVEVMLRKPNQRDLSWLRSALTPGPRSFTLQLHPRDDAGAQAFGELRNRGLVLIVDALYQSAEHVLGFLRALRAELAFYLGCLNLREQLDRIGETVAFPRPSDEQRRFACRNLRDVCLALTIGHGVVGNDVEAHGKALVVITGANRGGKSTFLRSVGLAQLMMQCGMFVTADAFEASLRSGLFTHYKREEDRSMRSGKFDEELVRMSTIADHIHRRALVLFNESFAATNEREGAEIARQVVTALLESEVTVFFVSHMYEFSRLFLDSDTTLFLRAERGDGGERSFRLREAKPLPTSFGADLYERIFLAPDGPRQAAAEPAEPPA